MVLMPNINRTRKDARCNRLKVRGAISLLCVCLLAFLGANFVRCELHHAPSEFKLKELACKFW